MSCVVDQHLVRMRRARQDTRQIQHRRVVQSAGDVVRTTEIVERLIVFALRGLYTASSEQL